VILVIDTSSATSAVALLGEGGGVVREEAGPSGAGFEVASRVKALRGQERLSKVVVATGPGSFTGLRSGVSFGLGLAIGLKIPIVPLPTLDLQAARAGAPVTAVSEAGRGRVYFLPADGRMGLAEPWQIPRDRPLVGWLRPATREALQAAGLAFEADDRLKTFGQAAAILLESAREVAYGSLRMEYMQSFSAPKT
jgi:hypothetical protein